MCGVAGYFGPVANGISVLAGMAGAIEHRGPDGFGTCLFPGAGLAHRRLAIVDLAEGAQPMTSADGRCRASDASVASLGQWLAGQFDQAES